MALFLVTMMTLDRTIIDCFFDLKFKEKNLVKLKIRNQFHEKKFFEYFHKNGKYPKKIRENGTFLGNYGDTL